MSTLTEMSPCSFEQGKAEAAKGITRRPRFVMKPNIRPGPSKPVSTAPKHKVTNASAMTDNPPSVSKSSLNPAGDDAAPHSENETAKSVSAVEESLLNQAQEVDNNVEVTLAPAQSIPKIEESVSKSENNLCMEITKNNESLLQENAAPESSLTCDQLDKTCNIPERLPKVDNKAIGICETEPEPKTVKDIARVDLRDSASEGDATCMSECMSLEPDNERRADVDDDLKKTKKRRTKKLRAEPLPSREKSPDRQKMKMSDLLSWNPQQNFLPKKVKKKEATPASPEHVGKVDEERESSNQSASLPAPQVMIGPDGSVVLNTESLLIQSAPADTKLPMAIEEDDDDRYLNTNSYRKYKRTKFWTEDETDRFFLGLQMCGTDFSLMTNLMTNRTRRELKNKFHREEKRNRPLIDKALANRRIYDPAPFAEMVAAEEEKVKKSAEKKVKPKPEVKKEKKPANKKTQVKRKKSDSENEEDDWKAFMDEDDEDVAEELPVVKRKKKSEPKVPVSVSVQPVVAANQPDVVSQVTNTNSSPANTVLGTNALQSIPGSSQVQIEMEGVNNPVQGVLIPKSMIPLIAPQLGIPATATDYQVLLVQEQSSAGNLVHVYIIPDSEKKDSAASSAQGSSSLQTELIVPGSRRTSNHLSPASPTQQNSTPEVDQGCSTKTYPSAPGATSFASYATHSNESHSDRLADAHPSLPSPIGSHHTTIISELPGPHHQTLQHQGGPYSPSQTYEANHRKSYSHSVDICLARTNQGNEVKALIVEDDQCEEDRYTLTSL